MKIENVRIYLDALGDQVEIICTDWVTSDWPIIGICRKNGNILTYDRNGKCSNGYGSHHLIKEYKEPTIKYYVLHKDDDIQAVRLTQCITEDKQVEFAKSLGGNLIQAFVEEFENV